MKRKTTAPLQALTLGDHILELRRRLLTVVIVLVLAGLIAYVFYEPILTFLRWPLDAPLYYSSPAGSFAFIMKVCGISALIAAIPIIVYNLIMFIRPAYQEIITIGRVYGFTLASIILAIVGMAFGYFFVAPGALHFFAGFQVDGLSALISADSYLNFITNILLTFALVFQLPLLLLFIDRVKPIPPKTLLRSEKWVLLSSLVISLLVPFALDLTTSLLIASPIFILYNLSILAVLLQHAIAKSSQRQLKPVDEPNPYLAFAASALQKAITIEQRTFLDTADESLPLPPIETIAEPTTAQTTEAPSRLPQTRRGLNHLGLISDFR